jgi:hypothetical protein
MREKAPRADKEVTRAIVSEIRVKLTAQEQARLAPD